MRTLLVIALLAPSLAPAQTNSPFGVQVSLQVTRLAPQLVSFAGSQANFDSLANGLALGTTVTLSTALPDGQVQLVSFTPRGTMTATQVAQTLETARQDLISRGVAAPTGQQVAITLTGGALPTTTGNVQVTGLLPAANRPAPAAASAMGGTSTVTVTTISPNGSPSPSALIQGQSGAGGTTPPSPAQIIQNQRGSNISDTPTTGNISNTPSPTATTTAPVTAPAPVQSAPLAPAPTAPGDSRFAPPAR